MLHDSSQVKRSLGLYKIVQADSFFTFEKRFAIANFYFDNPLITKVTKDTKMSIFDKLVSIRSSAFFIQIKYCTGTVMSMLL